MVFLLGFFVKQIVARWWTTWQAVPMPGGHCDDDDDDDYDDDAYGDDDYGDDDHDDDTIIMDIQQVMFVIIIITTITTIITTIITTTITTITTIITTIIKTRSFEPDLPLTGGENSKGEGVGVEDKQASQHIYHIHDKQASQHIYRN